MFDVGIAMKRKMCKIEKGNKNFKTPTKLELFLKILNGFQLLSVFAKRNF